MEIDKSLLAAKKLAAARDTRLFSVLRDCALQLVFLFVVLVMAYANRDTRSHRLNTAIKNNLALTFNKPYTDEFTTVCYQY